jgi:hypothetical protein
MKPFFKNLLFISTLTLVFFISLYYYIKQQGFRDPEPDENRKIIVVNKSNKIIYWLLSDYGNFNSYVNKSVYDSIKSNSNDSILCDGWSWESVEDKSINKKICIFIIVQDSIDKYSIDKILKKQIYTKKILVDIDYLDKNNWTIVYK